MAHGKEFGKNMKYGKSMGKGHAYGRLKEKAQKRKSVGYGSERGKDKK